MSRWLLAVAATVFVLYALNYLYFFVDDEGIPYVYAQNVLHGHGLTYNTLEGPVEGYSDFLHVVLATLILAVVRGNGLPKISVFFIGKAVSFACGVGIVFLVWRIIRQRRLHGYATIVGMTVVCLSGPLAVWSCSSLETVPFALGVLGLAWALLSGRDTAALASAAFLVLERLDGFIYAGFLVAAFLVCAERPRRREMVLRVVVPLLGVCAAYHAWRYWYFRDLVPAPVEAKVLYKLTRQAAIVSKPPDVPYILGFAQMYGWSASIALLLALLAGIRAGGPIRALSVATVGLIAYVATVGDWMFGFRFFVPLTGLLAILSASATDDLSLKSRRAALTVCVLAPCFAVAAAVEFVSAFRASQSVDSFLARPSLETAKFFRGYYALYETARHIMFPGQVVAYNQAGFLPYMLDLTNIDNLGICSRFYANMPTTDVFFTEVGRYSPLTRNGPLGATEAYLLYRNAEFLIVREDLLMNANGGSVPPDLLDCHYALLTTDAMGQNSIYVRTDRSAADYAADPHAFVENLAHVSHLRRASVDGHDVSRHDYLERFPFLATGVGAVSFRGRHTLDLIFADADENVVSVTAGEISCDRAVTAGIWFMSEDHRVVHRAQLELPSTPNGIGSMPVGARANRLLLDFSAPDRSVTTCHIADLRVVGQSRALADYVKETLTFPAPR